MGKFNKLCTAFATLDDEQAERVVSYIETLGKSQGISEQDKGQRVIDEGYERVVSYIETLGKSQGISEQDNWQRVIDEGYLCKFWDDDSKFPNKGTLITADRRGGSWLCENGKWHANCEVLREKGIKQPYFLGDDIPDVSDGIVIYYKDSVSLFNYDDIYTKDIDWSNVVAYIEV